MKNNCILRKCRRNWKIWNVHWSLRRSRLKSRLIIFHYRSVGSRRIMRGLGTGRDSLNISYAIFWGRSTKIVNNMPNWKKSKKNLKISWKCLKPKLRRKKRFWKIYWISILHWISINKFMRGSLIWVLKK